MCENNTAITTTVIENCIENCTNNRTCVLYHELTTLQTYNEYSFY